MKFAFRSLLALALLAVPAALTVGALQGEPAKAGPEHAVLKKMAGSWDVVVKTMGTESKGSYEAKATMNDLWVLGDFSADFMGMDFQGHSVTGYDPEKKEYVSTWVDSMSAKLNVYSGTYDKENGVLLMRGTGTNPMTGEPVAESHRTTFEGDDKQIFEMIIHPEDGEAMTLMTIEYTRRK